MIQPLLTEFKIDVAGPYFPPLPMVHVAYMLIIRHFIVYVKAVAITDLREQGEEIFTRLQDAAPDLSGMRIHDEAFNEDQGIAWAYAPRATYTAPLTALTADDSVRLYASALRHVQNILAARDGKHIFEQETVHTVITIYPTSLKQDVERHIKENTIVGYNIEGLADIERVYRTRRKLYLHEPTFRERLFDWY